MSDAVFTIDSIQGQKLGQVFLTYIFKLEQNASIFGLEILIIIFLKVGLWHRPRHRQNRKQSALGKMESFDSFQA